MPMYSAYDDPKGPGFPIRISADQRVLAPPHGFSQRATSFIASQCQGIHQMPLKRLIAQKPVTHRDQNRTKPGSDVRGQRSDVRKKSLGPPPGICHLSSAICLARKQIFSLNFCDGVRRVRRRTFKTHTYSQCQRTRPFGCSLSAFGNLSFKPAYPHSSRAPSGI